MFDQCGYFTEIPWQEGLKSFCSIIYETDIDWWLTGSCATCIRGIELKPHDIDIMVKSEYLDEVIELFSDYIIEPIIDTNGWIIKYFGVVFLHSRIDLAFDRYSIKVPPLRLQINTNKLRGRDDRVEKINNYLARH
jgi:hypothetical protein